MADRDGFIEQRFHCADSIMNSKAHIRHDSHAHECDTTDGGWVSCAEAMLGSVGEERDHDDDRGGDVQEDGAGSFEESTRLAGVQINTLLL